MGADFLNVSKFTQAYFQTKNFTSKEFLKSRINTSFQYAFPSKTGLLPYCNHVLLNCFTFLQIYPYLLQLINKLDKKCQPQESLRKTAKPYTSAACDIKLVWGSVMGRGKQTRLKWLILYYKVLYIFIDYLYRKVFKVQNRVN